MMKSVLLLLFLLLLIQGFASNEIYISSNGSSEASCGSIHFPYLSLSDITQWENDTVVIIKGSIVLDRVIEIHSIHNLTFTSSSSNSNKKEKAAVINCVCPSYNNCGLIIEDCQDVTFNDLNVFGCSVQHVIGVSMRHYYRSGIIVNTTTNMLLSNVSISKNIGTGLLLINAAGNITIEESVFSNNSIPYALQQIGSNGSLIHGGSGLVILISACEVTADNCMHNTSASGNYKIQGTLFNNNTVNLTDFNREDWSFSYGGGLGIFLIWNVKGNIFSIKGTNFTGNKATVGGGMIWDCGHFCQGNIINLENCSFSKNLFSNENLDFGGAGMAIGIAHRNSSYVSADNNITVVGTTFSNNTGNYASGVLIYCNALGHDEPIKSYNYVHFIRSTWDSNNGTAIEIEPNYKSQYFTEFTTRTIFEDCIFANNAIMKQYNYTKMSFYTFSEGIGAFVITKLTVYFKGNNSFNDNKGTALYIFSGSAYFEKGAVTIFKNNTGTYGGAIGLVGYSTIQYKNDTKFEFRNNSASIVGGAIYITAIRPHISLSSHLCFLQHHHTKHPNANNVIASGGSVFTVSQPTPLSIIPGRKYSLPITLYDDMGQNITKIATFQSTLSKGKNIDISAGFEFVSNKQIKITGKPGENDDLSLRLIGFENIEVSIGIELASCPPGYVIDDDSSSCVCSASQNNKSLTYVGIYRCDESKEVALALKGYWAGYLLQTMVESVNIGIDYKSIGIARSVYSLLNHTIIRGIGSKNYLYVVCWDGSLKYFSTQHLWYAIPALICFFLFIIPFPLILTFDGLLLKVESKLAIRFAFIRRLMPWTAIHYKLKPLLDSFQGPFKDQYRFFAGLYFFYRLLLLSLFVMASTEFQNYLFSGIALILIIMLQATVQPFQENKHNTCAILTFVNMGLITIFTVCIFFLESVNGYEKEVIIAQCIQIVLIYIPLVAVAFWLLRIYYYKIKVKGRSFDYSYGELLFNRSGELSDKI
uniref:Right handed beta helix domain-containing protein n=1 Tax=Amphimedon queenslandica TaxID=400682 RepID=A0A1X7TRW0_AMPQE